ncbi:hypothetical protein NHQ30_000601 [Ciborinia camelliae]|nr:hypothetical protein NHQ30_000601 [Ciborinia camelliae]
MDDLELENIESRDEAENGSDFNQERKEAIQASDERHSKTTGTDAIDKNAGSQLVQDSSEAFHRNDHLSVPSVANAKSKLCQETQLTADESCNSGKRPAEKNNNSLPVYFEAFEEYCVVYVKEILALRLEEIALLTRSSEVHETEIATGSIVRVHDLNITALQQIGILGYAGQTMWRNICS